MTIMKSLYLKEWIFFKTNLAIAFGWLVVLALCFTCLFYLAFLQNPEIMEKVWKSIGERFREAGLLNAIGKNPPLLAIKIFYINTRTTFFFTVLGFIPFFLGVFPFLMTISVLLGVSLALAVTKGYGFLTFIKLTAPHGVFELIAVIYGVSLGVYFSKEMTKKLLARHRGNSIPFTKLMEAIPRSYLLVILPLLAFAAVVEVLATPLFK